VSDTRRRRIGRHQKRIDDVGPIFQETFRRLTLTADIHLHDSFARVGCPDFKDDSFRRQWLPKRYPKGGSTSHRPIPGRRALFWVCVVSYNDGSQLLEIPMIRVFGTFEQGQIVLDTPAEWPDGSRVEVSLVAPGAEPGNGQGEPPPGVRNEFLDAMRDPNRFGLEESLWPQTAQEREIWLQWFDCRDRLDLSDEEVDRMEAFWRESKVEQKEMVRQTWEKRRAVV